MNQCVKYKQGKIRKDCTGLDFRMWAVGRIKENWNGRFFVTEKVAILTT